MYRFLLFVIGSFALSLMAGCKPAQPPQQATAPSEHHGHSHEALGPNGGHLIELGDEEYHLEWNHDDETGLVTVYVLDSTARELVPITAEAITISVKVEETTDYDLVAIDPSGEPPQSAQFAAQNTELITMLSMAGQGAEPKAIVPIGGKEFTAVFERHEHHH